MDQQFVLGLDFGTDSVRALIVNALSGEERSEAVAYYPRWKEGLFRDSDNSMFCQHPLDYIDSLRECVREAVSILTPGERRQIRGIGIDATGSTICAVDRQGIPLSLNETFSSNTNAMFLLWKDHRAKSEAEEITSLSRQWEIDITEYNGGSCLPEWFWPKVLWVLRHDQKVMEAAFSWVEFCDWIPALLTGHTDPLTMRRSRGAAGHKALWNKKWGGLPSEAFLATLDPSLSGIRRRLYTETFYATTAAGGLCKEWANYLDLEPGITVTVGTLDGHVGGLTVPSTEKSLVKTIGTSSVDVLVVSPELLDGRVIPGLCGQVEGSMIPGMVTLELGQAAFGDVFAWFSTFMRWPLENMGHVLELKSLNVDANSFYEHLTARAEKCCVSKDDLVIVGWLNGRRSPFGNQALKGRMSGVSMATSPVEFYRALVESVAFGTRDIMEYLVKEGFPVEEVVLLGQLGHKNKFLVQVLSDVLGIPVKVARSRQVCAAGAAILASVAATLYPSIPEAQMAIGEGFVKTYTPRKERHQVYNQLYKRYCSLGTREV